MTNARGEQILIPVPASRELRDEIVRAMQASGYTNRSDFIRDAIVEKAAKVGVTIPQEMARGPMRSSLARKTTYLPHRSQNVAMNETNCAPPSPKTVEEAERREEELAAELERKHAARVPILRDAALGRKKPRPA